MIGGQWRVAMLMAAAVFCGWVASRADDDSNSKPKSNDAGVKEAQSKESPAPRKPPGPLSENVKRGLDYLVAQQDSSGGWGQGGGWRTGEKGRVEGKDVKDPPDVGNTCIAALALIRSGSTPKEGPYAASVAKAVTFITAHVNDSDEKSLYVTNQRDTQLQSKIGRYVDTFLAGMVLSELKGKMPDRKGEELVLAALNKTVHKIELNQKGDGNFAQNVGWASVLSQGLCSKAISRAKLAGVEVKEETIDRDVNHTVAQLDPKTGSFAAGGSGLGGAGLGGKAVATATPTGVAGIAAFSSAETSAARPSDAGVKIYNESANGTRLQEQVNSVQPAKAAAQQILKSATAPQAAKEAASGKLKQIEKLEAANSIAKKGIAANLSDQKFVAGFGNNGGEEYLSYMNISETLVVNGGAEWDKWNTKAAETINAVQNKDGSWSGSHCITGRTFCTSAALLTLMADRMPVPVAVNLASEK